LREGLLWQEAEVFNTGDDELPLGYGIHPWFNLPLRSGSRGDAVVGVPAAARWELEACIPTGRVLPVERDFDLRKPRRIEGLTLDDVYTQLEYQKGWGIATLADPSGLKLEVGFDKAFRELVVYAPPQRDVICFEPYTCTTNALNLQPDGVDAGLLVLQPKQSWRGMIYFAAQAN
ncbi:MAG TPA: aldose 1-epimerase, partial [Limnochordia bacterium]|nr:aldose 1-epimerase [Limnochordia bacterium]